MTRNRVHTRLMQVEQSLYVAVRAICISLLGLIVIAISAAVFARFIIFTPLNFADPLSKYLMQWLAFLGMGLAMRRGEHVLVSALADHLPQKARRMLAVAISLAVAGLFTVILIYGWKYALSGLTSSDPFVFGVPMIIPYLSVPVGALYAVVQALLTLGITLTGTDDENPLPHSAAQGI